MYRHRSIPIVILAILAGVASASEGGVLRFVHQDGSAGAPATAEDLLATDQPVGWHVQIEPMVRYISPSGDLTLPGTSASVEPVDLADVNLNAPRPMPGFDLSLRRGNWRLNAIGLFYDIDGQFATADEAFTLGGVDFAAGQRSSVAHTYTQLDFRLARTIIDRPFRSRLNPERFPARFRLDVEGGLRSYDFEFEFENLDTGDRGSDDRTFFEPHAGVKAGLTLYDELTIDLYTNFGFWPTDAEAFSWDIGVGFQWRPTENVGLQIGYRSTIFRLNEGSGLREFEWEGSYQGLYAGLQFRF
ncbi:MAG: hypothetical protein HRU13_00420 [Phycisphaerales bacterium]|nr:hypothetical protein [Phycisphaerales bacterium]